MSVISQQPDALSFSGNLKPFQVTSLVAVIFELKKGATLILSEKYNPDASGIVSIDVKAIIERLLDVSIPDNQNIINEQTLPVASFTATIDGVPILFKVIKGGVAELQETATTWLDAHFLTWQPQTKLILQTAPEWLGIYAILAGTIKLKAYYADGTTYTGDYAVLAQDKLYSINTSWGVVSAWLVTAGQSSQAVAWDAWFEVGGIQKITVQRYQLRNASEDEHSFIWWNTLGAIDSISFTGAQEDDQKLTHQTAEYTDESIGEYDIDKDREVKQSTGFLDSDENAWIKDFFVSRKKYAVRIDGSLKQIAVVSSKVVSTTQDDVFDYEFTFRYGEDSKLLNIDRILELQAPEGLADFFLAELLAGMPSALYQNNLLLAVQSPFALGWRKLSMAELWAGALPELVDGRTITFNNGKLTALGVGSIDDFTWEKIHDLLELGADSSIPDTRTILISGAIIWESGLTYQSTKLVYKILGENYQISPQSVTLDAADPTLDRIDVFYVDSSSEIGVLKGTPGLVPVKPTVGINQIEVAYALIKAGATEPDLTVDIVYDENIVTEWAHSESHDLDILVNFDATTNPIGGTKQIEVTLSIPETTVANPTHFIGEHYQGGIIFYLSQGGKSGYISSELASSPGVRYGESHSSGPTDTSIGAGIANTIALLANPVNSTCAAFYVANFEKDGFSDWFLGSKMEMEQLVFRKSLFPNLKGAFWTSTQVTGANDWKRAYASIFDNSTTSDWDKTRSFQVVPIRYFDDGLLSAGTPVDIYTPEDTALSFVALEPIEMTNGILSFYMQSSAEWLPKTALTLKLCSAGNVVGHAVMANNTGMAGYNSADPEWQLIAIPLALLSMVSNTVDELKIILSNSWPNGIIISIDRIRIQHDLSQIAIDILKPGIYGSATKNLIITVDEAGKIKKIEEVDNGIGDIAAALDLING